MTYKYVIPDYPSECSTLCNSPPETITRTITCLNAKNEEVDLSLCEEYENYVPESEIVCEVIPCGNTKFMHKIILSTDRNSVLDLSIWATNPFSWFSNPNVFFVNHSFFYESMSPIYKSTQIKQTDCTNR